MVLRPSSDGKLIQSTTQQKQTNPQPNPNTTLLRIIIVNICRAAQEIRPSRWVSIRGIGTFHQLVVKELPRALYFIFADYLNLKMYNLFFLNRSHTISSTYILPVGNTPY